MKKVLMMTAASLLLAACVHNPKGATVGLATGAGSAYACSQLVGSGTGSIAAAAGCGVGGALVGYWFGSSMDSADRADERIQQVQSQVQQMQVAQSQLLHGQQVMSSPAQPSYPVPLYYVTPMPSYGPMQLHPGNVTRGNGYCRSFDRNIFVGSGVVNETGVACMGEGGHWQVVR